MLGRLSKLLYLLGGVVLIRDLLLRLLVDLLGISLMLVGKNVVRLLSLTENLLLIWWQIYSPWIDIP